MKKKIRINKKLKREVCKVILVPSILKMHLPRRSLMKICKKNKNSKKIRKKLNGNKNMKIWC